MYKFVHVKKTLSNIKWNNILLVKKLLILSCSCSLVTC